jgi:hypothetical protein
MKARMGTLVAPALALILVSAAVVAAAQPGAQSRCVVETVKSGAAMVLARHTHADMQQVSSVAQTKQR